MAQIINPVIYGGGTNDPVRINNGATLDKDYKYVVAVSVASVGDTGSASTSISYTGSGTKIAEVTGIGDHKWMHYIFRIYKDCKAGDKFSSSGYWQLINTFYGFE